MMDAAKKLTPQEFRTMQLLELDLLIEFDRVCRKHGIKYCITSGTLLGAVRHKGYIPWDDDSDIAMLREEYEKFRAVADEMDASVCYFQDHYNDPEYLWQYGKLRRTGTSFVRAGQEHMKGKTGVFVDIFVLLRQFLRRDKYTVYIFGTAVHRQHGLHTTRRHHHGQR